jgi:glyoxylase-like metal-dependent hydrolase (beta-lactamase superfamily II)
VLTLGRYRLAALQDGTFALDGGGVFGVVPRAIWERQLAPDARHRVRLAARCLLAVDEAAGRRILVDAGLGTKLDPVRLDRYAVDRSGGDLDAGLAAHGLTRADVTDVILGHLQFDHAGGCTRRGAGGALETAFPHATFHVQRRAWLWAHAPSEKDAAGYLQEDFALLEHSGRLHLVEGQAELFPDVELIVAEGPTVAQQLPRFHGGGRHLTVCGDVIPTRFHVRVPWIAAYDLAPLTTLEEKKMLLAEALEEDGLLFFTHDPDVAACRLYEEAGRPALREAVRL